MKPTALLTLVLLSGCGFLRSGRAPLATESLTSQGASCVIVLLPGLGDPPSRFEQHAFQHALAKSEVPCDLEVVDSHFGYYREAVIAERLGALLVGLRERHEQVWLAGVSLGGYGAALSARARPDLVDGVILISPFLGVPSSVRPLVERIEREGGLDAFEGPVAWPTNPRKHFTMAEPLWLWLGERARAEGGPRLVLAFGEDDGFAWKHRVVGAALDAQDVIRLPGGHDWDTFSRLWREVTVRAPWNAAASRKALVSASPNADLNG